MNGQRMAESAIGAGLDLNFIPQAAVGRLEIGRIERERQKIEEAPRVFAVAFLTFLQNATAADRRLGEPDFVEVRWRGNGARRNSDQPKHDRAGWRIAWLREPGRAWRPIKHSCPI